MRRLIFVVAACACMGVPALANISINYNHAIAGDLTLTTPYSGAIVDNFDSGRPGWTYTGNGAIVTGSASVYTQLRSIVLSCRHRMLLII